MHGITDADREAAGALREALADLTGFWFRPGDDSPLCQALARHRSEAEQRLAGKLAPFTANHSPPRRRRGKVRAGPGEPPVQPAL